MRISLKQAIVDELDKAIDESEHIVRQYRGYRVAIEPYTSEQLETLAAILRRFGPTKDAAK